MIQAARRMALGTGLLAGLACPAAAHWLSPAQVIASLGQEAVQREYAVTDAKRSEVQPRLLVVSVGPEWSRIAPERRRAAAERWRREWRESVPSGVLAIVDAVSQRSLVSFDARGHAQLQEARPAAAPEPSARHSP